MKKRLLGKLAIEYWSDMFDREVYIKELKKRGYLDNFEVMFKTKNGNTYYQSTAIAPVFISMYSRYIGAKRA